MAASFLPYCAHCDKQIVIPNSGILYCSESCRKKDQKQSPAPIIGSAPQYSTSNRSSSPPLSPSQSFAELPPPPTYVSPSSPTSARSIPFAHKHENRQTSEPIAISSSYTDHHHHNNNNNVNMNGLRRSTTWDAATSAPSSPTNSHNLYLPPRRPAQFNRSTTSSYMGSTTSGSSTPYYPVQGQYFHSHTRPLPPTHHPYSYSSSPRSIDLVTPLSSVSSCSSQQHAHEHVQTEAEREEMHLYEKKWALPVAGSAYGSLKKLFNFDGMRASAPMSGHGSRSGSPVPMSRSGSSTSIHSIAPPPTATEKNQTMTLLDVRGDWSDIY